MELQRRVWMWATADAGGDDTTSHELIKFLCISKYDPLQ